MKNRIYWALQMIGWGIMLMSSVVPVEELRLLLILIGWSICIGTLFYSLGNRKGKKAKGGLNGTYNHL